MKFDSYLKYGFAQQLETIVRNPMWISKTQALTELMNAHILSLID